MASGYNAGRFNLALAGGVACAAGFALFAMPAGKLERWLDAFGLLSLVSPSPEVGDRIGIVAVSAALSFLLSWLMLRSCDPTSRVVEEVEDDWSAPWITEVDSKVDLVRAPDDPFAELARHAEPVGEPLDLTSEQALPPSSDASASLTTRELLARMPSLRPAQANVSSLVHHLNMGLVESEWPLPSGEKGERPDQLEDRLRNVLQDLHSMTQGR
jgi:hypothetical protein